jgi:hypothetical protein
MNGSGADKMNSSGAGKMDGFSGGRAVRSHSFTVALPMAEAFRLFEPEGERAWAQGWDPRYVFPADGTPERGMVFTTSHGNESTIWNLTRHDPQGGVVEYLRVTPGSRVAVVLVQCAEIGPRKTRVTVVYTFTGLNEAGNEYVRAMDEAHYRAFIDGWATAIEASLRGDAGGGRESTA